MRNNYLKGLFAVALLSASATAGAVVFPTYPTQELQDGGKYIICNLAVPTGYMARTSWDGAYYFLGETDSKYQDREITAHYDAENNRWFFTTSETQHEATEEEEAYTSYTYFGVPSGTDNVNGNLTEEAYWTVTPGITSGFYYLTAGDGQGNSMVIGLNMHLNSGGQYWVISEPTNGWYADFYGGFKYEEDGETPVTIYDEETGLTYKVMADSTSMNWAFVKVEDVPTYVQVGTQWAKLNSFEKNYCSIEGYEEGFKLTLTAAETAFNGGDYEAMQAIIDAKVNLYNQLLKALVTQEETTSLDKAIEAAQTAFNTQSDAETVAAAYEALKKACDDYAMGLGDITSMAQNVSFEDLSAQNGSTTTGVAAPPAGWEVYIDDVKMESQADVNKSIYNWHGVNADCSGYKDGDYGFGIWTSKIPDYQISQTISGLDNGAYTVTCGLMVGANGNGSRRTTQRVFANLSSTYFASEEEYNTDLLDEDLRGYANLQEPTTDTEMQQISVQAFVYDGTLTFGIRTNGDYEAALRETSNSAGGDGWFKCDNFTITKDGENHDLAYATAEMACDQFDGLSSEPMPAELKTIAESLADKFSVNSSMSDDELAQAIVAVKEASESEDLANILAGIDAYTDLKAEIDLTAERLDVCDEAGYKGVDDFWDAYDDVNNKYEGGAYATAEVEAAIQYLEEAYQTCLHSGVDEGADVSDLITNRSFEDLRNQNNTNSDGTVNAPYGWDLYLNGVKCETADEIKAQGVNGWCAINSGDGINVTDEYGNVHTHQYTDGTHLWGIWNSSIPQVELSQTLTGLTPGTYTLTCDVMARCTDWSGDNLTTQRIFANNVVCVYGTENDYIPEYLQGTTSDDIYQAYNLTINEGKMLDEDNEYEYMNYGGWDAYSNDQLLRTLILHFGVDETGVATIGFRTDALDGWTGEAQTQTASGWFKLDNFTLYFESGQIPTRIENAQVATTGKSAIYNLAGQRVSKAVKGVYIQNGKKVLK